ncbi:uncharacterized protein LOC130625795 [Hydractinia symbiolongicarpus]|uniref:uncharacterized protein LOC130625795 n=1 Tax=Hydractinia symbiolongicarpus TaxID=13093 RepID=UPI00254AB868|nr:uncharacterized protein LOC130625795 [Hydractinia symbiolongicarpus]
MMWLNHLLLISWLSGCSFFQVKRQQDSDVVSDSVIGGVCGQASSCICPNQDSLGTTFFSPAGADMCVNEISDCNLLVEDEDNKLHKLFAVKVGSSSQMLHSITVVTGNASVSVCSNDNPVASPIFVRDNLNTLVWNANWSPEFKNRVVSEKFGNKVKLNMSTHWSGLLVKIYISCGTEEQCVAVKFLGTQEYPLQEQAVSTILGSRLPEKTSVINSLSLSVASLPKSRISSTATYTSMSSETITPSTQDLSTSSLKTQSAKLTTLTASMTTESPAKHKSSFETMSETPAATSVKTPEATPPATSAPTLPSFSIKSSSLEPVLATPSLILTTAKFTHNFESINPTTSTTHTNQVSSSTTVVIPKQDKLLDDDDDNKFLEIFISLSVALILIIIILFIVWFCKRRRRKIKMEEERRRNRLRVEYASIKYLNNSANGSISSAAAVLNSAKALSTKGLIEEDVMKSNPTFELSDRSSEVSPTHSDGTLRELSPLPDDKPMYDVIETSIYDNPGYTSEDDPKLEKSEYPSNEMVDDDTMFHFNHEDTGHVEKVRRHSLEPIQEHSYNII